MAGAGAILAGALGVAGRAAPPAGPAPGAAHPVAAALAAEPARSASVAVADLVVSLAVRPNQPGRNAVTVLTTSSRRPPPAPVDRVLVEFAAGVPLTLVRTAAGTFSGTASFVAAGRLPVTVSVRRAGQRIAVPMAWAVDPAEPYPTVPGAAEPAAGGPAAAGRTGQGDSPAGYGPLGTVALAAAVGAALLLLARRWSGRQTGRPAATPRAAAPAAYRRSGPG